MHNSPIVIVEDDDDDCQLLVRVFKEVGVTNEFRCFDSPLLALDYLKTTTETPFIIVSDINMPIMDGLAFKRCINDDNLIGWKKIPFIFLSTSKENTLLKEACNLSIQGYFQKPDDINSLKEIARAIIEYWKKSAFNLN